MLKEFRDFILRDRLIDLAVAVVVGTAFGTLVMALVRDLITPLIAALGGKPDFSDLAFTINDSRFAYGDLINALISFLIVAAAVFFFVVHPLGKVKQRVERTKREMPAVPERDPGGRAALRVLYGGGLTRPSIAHALERGYGGNGCSTRTLSG
jgi:large conductance mechanosensitive channel